MMTYVDKANEYILAVFAGEFLPANGQSCRATAT